MSVTIALFQKVSVGLHATLKLQLQVRMVDFGLLRLDLLLGGLRCQNRLTLLILEVRCRLWNMKQMVLLINFLNHLFSFLPEVVEAGRHVNHLVRDLDHVMDGAVLRRGSCDTGLRGHRDVSNLFVL